MRIYYGVTADGMHLTAHTLPSSSGMTSQQRELLCEFFAALCFSAEISQGQNAMIPKQMAGYVLIRIGHDGEQHFAEYALGETH